MALSKKTRIAIMIVLDTIFCLIELSGAVWLQSLALMADAFHMLNDIISLAIGYYAVSMSEKSSSEKFTYGYLRAEILGAFFNAVFLIALCVSIILEAINRFVELPDIQSPKTIVIVGILGLISNGVGFLVLGGHDHDHDHVHDHEHNHEHEHDHDPDHDGPSHDHAHGEDNHHSSDPRAIEEGYGNASARRKHQRLHSVDEISIYPPSSFRHDILTTSRKLKASPDTDEDRDTENATETTSLLHNHGSGSSHAGHSHDNAHNHSHTSRTRRDSAAHDGHNHNLPLPAASSSHGHNHADMGMNAMILHVIGDALGNVGVIITGLVIWLSDWRYKNIADPLTSLAISFIILYTAIPLTRATAKVLLQATPDHLDVSLIRQDIEGLDGVVSCHHVHIWQLSDTKIVASMHIQVDFPENTAGADKYMKLARSARKCLHAYGIHSATIQPEYCSDPANAATLEQQALRNQTDPAHPIPVDTRSEVCLLECVEDCVGKGCCPSPARPGSVESTHSGSSHEHQHDEHDDGHEH